MAAIMFQGTGSNVGKSLIVAGLARAFANRGLSVMPFKPQNMSNNAAVTVEGGEIGRAQALQAKAARKPLSVHMNPVLLKPQSEIGSQIVVQGRVWGNATARQYQDLKSQLMPAVMDSFALTNTQADLVLVEGAGSASEINLRQNDIANMGFARASNTPVVLVGDIDRGGVIASLVGTKTVIDPLDAQLIQGFIVNKMRGDRNLFDAGMRAISKASGWPGLGLIPYFPRAKLLPAEDAFELEQRLSASARPAKLTLAVIMLPRISNFDDLDPLIAEPDVNVVFLNPGDVLPICDVVILPGSKSTIADLAELVEQGWDIDIKAHVRRGGRVLGICGGFQMLGREVRDPEGTEGPVTHIKGLGLFDCVTVLGGKKLLREVEGLNLKDGVPFKGYEMHIGETRFDVPPDRFLKFNDGREDGAVSAHGRVQGTYVHGLFAHDGFRMAWLRSLGQAPGHRSHEAEVDAVLDELAAHLEKHMDIDQVLKLAR